jgi:hypothetical protein
LLEAFSTTLDDLFYPTSLDGFSTFFEDFFTLKVFFFGKIFSFGTDLDLVNEAMTFLTGFSDLLERGVFSVL